MNKENHNIIELPEEEGIDIKKYIFLILSHWWWFAIAIFVSLTIAYLVNRYSQQVYSANCSMIIGEPDSGAGSVENILDELARAKGKKRTAVVENEVSILQSYKMAQLALQELDFDISYVSVGRRNIAQNNLYKHSPFYVIVDSTKPRPYGKYFITILSETEYILEIEEDYKEEHKFGEKINLDIGAFTIFRKKVGDYKPLVMKSNKYFFTINNMNQLTKNYKKAIKVDVNAEKGSVLTLSINGLVPSKITTYLNKLCEVYMQYNLDEKNLKSEKTVKFIDRQLKGIVDSLDNAGQDLEDFRLKNNVVDLSTEGTFLYEKMQNLLNNKVQLEINTRYYEYLLEYIEEKEDFSDVVAPSVVGIQDQLLNTLVAQLNKLYLDRRNMDMLIAETSPQIQVLNNEILNTKISLTENLKSLIEGNKISKNETQQQIKSVELEMKKLPGTERQIVNFERNFSVNDQIYTYLLEKRAEAAITQASNSPDHKILDVANVENVTLLTPKTTMNYLKAIIVGCGIPLIILLLIDFFNNKIVDKKQLESSLKVPVIGQIGHNIEGTELPIYSNPQTPLAESFRALRTSLHYLFKGSDCKVVGVSSAVSGEGKTFTSLNLATIFSLTKKKVLVISLDLRRPKVHKVFNMDNSIGMSTFLIGQNKFDDIIFESNIQNLFIATSGPIPPNPSELLESETMKKFIEEARKKFDYIIVDTPPIAVVTDTQVISSYLDAFIFVIRYNYSNKQVIELANKINKDKLFLNMGVVLNDISDQGYYGYSYKYSYGYQYSYGYFQDKKTSKNIFDKLFNR